MSLITTSKCCQTHDSTAVNGSILPGVGIKWCSAADGGGMRARGSSGASNNDMPPGGATLTVRMATQQLSCSAVCDSVFSAHSADE